MRRNISRKMKFGLNTSYLQILLCTPTGVTKNAVRRLQWTLFLSFPFLSHFSPWPSCSAVCGPNCAWTYISSGRATIVLLNDVNTPSDTMDWVWMTLTNPKQEFWCGSVNTLVRYLLDGNDTSSSVRLLTKLRCFFVFSIKCLCWGFRSFPSRGDSRENDSSTIILNQLHYSLPISLRQSCLGSRQVGASW